MKLFPLLIILLFAYYLFNPIEASEGNSGTPMVRALASDSVDVEDEPTAVNEEVTEEVTDESPSALAIISGRCNDFFQAVSGACDPKGVRSAAASIVRPEHAGKFNLAMMADLYDFVNNRWYYIEDPRGMDIPYPATESLGLMKGDCEDFAVLLTSLQWAVGAETRIYCGTNSAGGHCFCEVNLGEYSPNDIGSFLRDRYHLNSDDKLHGHSNEDGFWISLDWAAYPGGRCESYDNVTIYYPQRGYCERI